MWELQKADAAGEARAAADKPGPQGTGARNDFDKAIEALSSTVEAERAAAQAEQEAIELDRIARAAEIDAARAGDVSSTPDPPLSPTARADGAVISDLEEEIIQRLSESLAALIDESGQAAGDDHRDVAASRDDLDPGEVPERLAEVRPKTDASPAEGGGRVGHAGRRLHTREEVLRNLRRAEMLLEEMPEDDPGRGDVAKSVAQLHLLLGLDAQIRALSPSPDGGVLRYL